MRDLSALIVGRPEYYGLIKEGLKRFERATDFPEFIVHCRPSAMAYDSSPVGANHGVQVAFVEYDPGSSDESLQSRLKILRERQPNLNIVFYSLGTNTNLPVRDALTLAHYGVTNWVVSPQIYEKEISVENQVASSMRTLVAQDNIFLPIRVAIDGAGKLTQELLKRLQGMPWIDRVDVYSGSSLEARAARGEEIPGDGSSFSYQQVIKVAGIEGMVASGRATFHHSFDEWVSKVIWSDAFLFASGPHMIDYSRAARGDGAQAQAHTRELFEATLPKAKKVAKAIRERYAGITLVVSNPPELVAQALRHYGQLDPHRIVCPTPEGRRICHLLYTEIMRAHSPNRHLMNLDGNEPENAIVVRMFGTHSRPLPALNQFRVQLEYLDGDGRGRVYLDEPLCSLFKIEGSGGQRRAERDLTEWGVSTMRSAARLRASYYETPEIVRRALRRIAHLRQPPACATYCAWDPRERVFMHYPVVYNAREGTFMQEEHDYLAHEERIRPLVAQQIAQQQAETAFYLHDLISS